MQCLGSLEPCRGTLIHSQADICQNHLARVCGRTASKMAAAASRCNSYTPSERSICSAAFRNLTHTYQREPAAGRCTDGHQDSAIGHYYHAMMLSTACTWQVAKCSGFCRVRHGVLVLVESATSGGGVRTTLATAGSASMATPSQVSKHGLRRSLSPVAPSVMTADSNCHTHSALD